MSAEADAETAQWLGRQIKAAADMAAQWFPVSDGRHDDPSAGSLPPMTTDPRPRYLLHVVGKNIARETNIQPSPILAVDLTDQGPFEDHMLATVRRCFAHRPDLEVAVEWRGPRQASVWVGNGRRGEVAARFRITDITPADIARVGAPVSKELLP